MPDPRLTIGLVVRNGESHLAAAIQSILNQTFQQFRLIICDNASTDETMRIATRFASRDPRIGMVSVTGVEVARDMSHAKVFVTVLGKDTAADAAEAIETLNHAAGFLRTQVAKHNNARTTPKLRFIFDSSIGRGAQMSKLIDDAVAVDREHAQRRDDTVERRDDDSDDGAETPRDAGN